MCKCFRYKLKATFHFPSWPGNEAKILQLPSSRHSAIDQSYDLVLIGDGSKYYMNHVIPCVKIHSIVVKERFSCRQINAYGILHWLNYWLMLYLQTVYWVTGSVLCLEHCVQYVWAPRSWGGWRWNRCCSPQNLLRSISAVPPKSIAMNRSYPPNRLMQQRSRARNALMT